MKKIIVFDLKNTLVDEVGSFLPDARRAIKIAAKRADSIVLYSMNESWTYGVLNAYKEDFRQFSVMMLVSQKKVSDLVTFRGNKVLVVGDSENEEIAFGNELAFDTVTVKGIFPIDTIEAFLKGTS